MLPAGTAPLPLLLTLPLSPPAAPHQQQKKKKPLPPLPVSSSLATNAAAEHEEHDEQQQMNEADWTFTREIDALVPLVERFLSEEHLELEGRLGVFVPAPPLNNNSRGAAATTTTKNKQHSSSTSTFHFQSGVDGQYFQSVFSELSTCTTWPRVDLAEQSVDYAFSGNVRHTLHTKTTAANEKGEGPAAAAAAANNEGGGSNLVNEQRRSTIRKTVLETVNLRVSQRPFSLRVRLSEEAALDDDCPQMYSEECKLVRLKMRESFTDETRQFRYDLTRVNSGATVQDACQKGGGVEKYEVELEMLKKQQQKSSSSDTTTRQQARALAAAMVHRLVQLLGLFDETGRPVPLCVENVEHVSQQQQRRPLPNKKKQSQCGGTAAETRKRQKRNSSTETAAAEQQQDGNEDLPTCQEIDALVSALANR